MSERRPFPTAARKPPLAPRQAVFISLGGLAAGIVAVVLACTVFLVPLWQAMAYFAVGAYFVLALPWASLEWKTKNRAVRAHNYFVYFFIATVILILVMQWGTEHMSFPLWAVAIIVVAGVAAYSVMGYYAIINFRRWRHGEFRNLDEDKT